MIKKGFTLQELLITLGIVGVISALALPAIMSMRPDKNKTMYLKTYNTLTTLTSEILNDTSLYSETYDANGNPNCVGLGCNDRPSDPQYNNQNYEGFSKFTYLLTDRLNVEGGITGNAPNVFQFSTIDGVEWQIITACNNNSDGQRECSCPIIQLDVNPNSNDCHSIYSSICTKPTLFHLAIDTNGKIQATDAMGIAYLQNQTNMHVNDDDRDLAAQLIKNGTTTDKMYKALDEINKKKQK